MGREQAEERYKFLPAKRCAITNIALDASQVVVGVSTLAIYLWNLVKDRPSYEPSKSAGTLIPQQFARAFKPEELQVSIVHPGAV